MNFIWTCTCGCDTPVDQEQLGVIGAGQLFTCPGCKNTFAQVRRARGDKIWIPISEDIVKSSYYALFETFEHEED